MTSGEPLYQCPRCKSGPRPKGEWATRYGIMTCGVCLSRGGYVIMPEEVGGRTADQQRRDDMRAYTEGC
jgi:hypothetical protein